MRDSRAKSHSRRRDIGGPHTSPLPEVHAQLFRKMYTPPKNKRNGGLFWISGKQASSRLRAVRRVSRSAPADRGDLQFRCFGEFSRRVSRRGRWRVFWKAPDLCESFELSIVQIGPETTDMRFRNETQIAACRRGQVAFPGDGAPARAASALPLSLSLSLSCKCSARWA